LLVCLCGTPQRPLLGGVRGGRALNLELVRLMDSLDLCHAWLKRHYDTDSILAKAKGQLAKAESFQVLEDQLKALERLAGRRIAQQNPSRKSPRGRYWAPPAREPVSDSILTLDTLVIALQEIGLTARDAKKGIKALFAAIVDHLKKGGITETPLGVFEVVKGPKERTLFRLGKLRKIYTKAKRVAFRPSPELKRRVSNVIHS
jgi:nucleoid DNA-binding protein